MKRPVSVILAIFLLVPAGLLADSKNTAKYVEIHEKELLGKQVSLDVTHVEPIREASKRAESYGLCLFRVHTLNKKNQLPGGDIVALVEKDSADRFQKKFGFSPEVTRGRDRVTDSRLYRATLQKFPDGKVGLLDSEEAGEKAIDFFVAMAEEKQKKEADDKTAREIREKIRERMQRGGKGGVAKGKGGAGRENAKGKK